jgi:hypothetical protein
MTLTNASFEGEAAADTTASHFASAAIDRDDIPRAYNVQGASEKRSLRGPNIHFSFSASAEQLPESRSTIISLFRHGRMQRSPRESLSVPNSISFKGAFLGDTA